jgi:hypothetical protein
MPINPDLPYAFCELRDARPAYERAAAFYEGKVEEIYSSAKITRLLMKFGLNNFDNFNFAHIPVDAIANKLSIIAVSADDETDESEADTTLEDLWDYNELAEESRIAHRKAGVYGDYYMMVWPVIGDEDDYVQKKTPKELADMLGEYGDLTVNQPEPEEVTSKTIVAVDMTFHDPLTTRVFYSNENPLKKAFAIRSWTEGEKDKTLTRANLYYPDRIERYVYEGKPPRNRYAQTKWKPFTQDGEPEVLNNPFGEIPFFHFRNDRPYGKPDHINAYGPQLAINKLVTSHMATVDFQSFPQRYGLMDPTADQAGSQGADFNPFAPEDEDDPEFDDNESQLSADPSAFWDLKGYKAVGQFAPASPDAYLKPFDRYVKAMSQVTDTPMHFFAKDSTDRPPSGEMLRVANEPIDAKAEERQETYGSTWRKALTFALEMMGIPTERINISWRPVETVTDKTGWETVNLQQQAGVPRDVTLVWAGNPPEQVATWMEEEAARKAEETEESMANMERQAQIHAKYNADKQVVKNPNAPTNNSEGKSPAASGTE